MSSTGARDFSILLVDDDALPRRALARLLQHDGLMVSAVDGPAAAMDALSQGEYQVIISDHMMPGMSGLELLHQISELRPSTVRILSSGSANPSEISIARDAGDVHLVLQKPWTLQEVRQVVGEAQRMCAQRVLGVGGAP